MYQAAVDDVALPATKYNLILLYDIRHQAFVKWRLATAPSLAVSLFCIKSINSNDPTQNIKVVADAGSTVTINGFIDIEFVDWDTTSYSSYLVTGYDTFQSPTRFKYAPLVYVFSKKTETGFTEVGDELSPIRPGSLTMQARWNWADHTNAGKWGTSQQVYRHRRLYVPSEVDPANDFNTGEPIIVTRNKVRGRGRSLHLLFSSTAGMDAHIVGWAITAEAMTDN